MFLSKATLCLVAAAAGLAAGQTENTTTTASGSSPMVDLGYAAYKGNSPGNGVDEFLGMRYAKAPLGNLRFRAPLDPSSESEVQDATKVSFGTVADANHKLTKTKM